MVLVIARQQTDFESLMPTALAVMHGVQRHPEGSAAEALRAVPGVTIAGGNDADGISFAVSDVASNDVLPSPKTCVLMAAGMDQRTVSLVPSAEPLSAVVSAALNGGGRSGPSSGGPAPQSKSGMRG